MQPRYIISLFKAFLRPNFLVQPLVQNIVSNGGAILFDPKAYKYVYLFKHVDVELWSQIEQTRALLIMGYTAARVNKPLENDT